MSNLSDAFGTVRVSSEEGSRKDIVCKNLGN